MKSTTRICALCGLLVLSTCVMVRGQDSSAVQCTPTPVPTPKPLKQKPSPLVGKKEDVRRLAPTIGTGGAIGGPTGLFTIYDGQTLRWKEATLNVALSNFDRDPGNADITEVPYSFQTGLTDNIELFVSNTAYRAIKVNNPQNLSAFYLPNSTLPFGFRGPAVVLAPFNNLGVSGAIFRPANNQPPVAFPFVGQPSGNFGNVSFSGTLGVQNTGLKLFGGASNFPGIGSSLGGILPGIVLSLTPSGLPATFTIAPSYLPDAPFINHRYGQSTFAQTTIGLKIRLPLSTRNTGIGVVPFYRRYRSGAGDANAFNQLQRGASPGSTFGDIGVVGFADHRFTEHINVSANVGYIFSGNPRSTAFDGSTATLLDRPNEFTAGLGFDFPIKKHLQLIAEVRSTMYVGGQTPNAFQNNPVEFIGGGRYFFNNGIGIGLGYRLHVNQQSSGRFDGTLPNGFLPSSNPNGFMAQFWFGRHFTRYRDTKYNPETQISHEYIFTLACPSNQIPSGVKCPDCALCEKGVPGECSPQDTFDGRYITLRALPDDVDSKAQFSWKTDPEINALEGSGRKIRIDASSLPLNTRIIVSVTSTTADGKKGIRASAITVRRCPRCETPPPPCPIITASAGTADATKGTQITFSADAKTTQGAPYSEPVTYEWNLNVTSATIISGQNSSSIKVDTSGITTDTDVVATVTVRGLDPSCANEAKANTLIQVPPPQECKLFDSYGAIKYNDEKARLDNLAIQLRELGVHAYIVAYRGSTDPRIGNIGSSKLKVVGDICPEFRYKRAFDYLVYSRGVEASRIHYLDGGNREESSVELWVCPTDIQPVATPDTTIVRPPGTCVTQGTPITRTGRQRRTVIRKRK